MSIQQLEDIGLVGTTMNVRSKETGKLLLGRNEESPSGWTTAFSGLTGKNKEDVYTENIFHFKNEDAASAFGAQFTEEITKEARGYEYNDIGEKINVEVNGKDVTIYYGKPEGEK